MLAAPVVDPMTGEIIAEAGEVLTRERAEEIAAAGVNDVYLDVDGKPVRVFGNGMVDMKHYVDFDPAELGIKELVRGIILRQLMEQYEGDALKEAIRGEHRPAHPEAHHRRRYVRVRQLSVLPGARHRRAG